uniref:Mitochondrial import receptor subunit TOM22 homolog n=1 Tax=Cacopsylla melanoneura TaxID=428564 RepID=A0A8D9EUK4_9HEMI
MVSTSSPSGDSEIDSGMESMTQSSRDLTPEKSNPKLAIEDEDDDDDETLGERLYGLTEIFPESLRNGAYKTTKVLQSGIVALLPIVFETQRFEVQEMQRNQQKQILLGTGSSLGPGMAMMPSR